LLGRGSGGNSPHLVFDTFGIEILQTVTCHACNVDQHTIGSSLILEVAVGEQGITTLMGSIKKYFEVEIF
jgi:hypothetical protein